RRKGEYYDAGTTPEWDAGTTPGRRTRRRQDARTLGRRRDKIGTLEDDVKDARGDSDTPGTRSRRRDDAGNGGHDATTPGRRGRHQDARATPTRRDNIGTSGRRREGRTDDADVWTTAGRADRRDYT